MRCKHTKQGANDYWDENIDRYYEAREEAFKKLLGQFAEKYLAEYNITDVDRLSFSTFCEEFVIEDDLDFPDIDKWMTDEYEGMLGDCADQAYEEYRDRLGEND